MQDRKSSLGIAVWLGISAALFLIWWVSVPAKDWVIAQTTLTFGFLSATISIPLGFLLAWNQFRFRNLATTSCFLLVVSLILVPLHLHVAVWDAALGKLGWLRGLDSSDLRPWLTGFSAAVVVQGLAAVPWAALLGAVAVRRMQDQQEQMALLDASSLGVFTRITVRKWIPTVVLCLIWNVVLANREIAVSDIYQIGTFAEEVYLQYSGGRFDWFGIDPMTGEANQSLGFIAYILLTTWLLATGLISILSFLPDHLSFDSSVQPRPFSIGTTPFMSGLSIVIAGLMILVPVSNLVVRAGLHTVLVEGNPESQFSLGHFANSIGNVFPTFKDEASWSILLGLATALTTALISFAVVRLLLGKKAGWAILSVLVALGFALPGPLVGAFVARSFSAIHLDGVQQLYNRSIAGPLVATTLIALGPTSILILMIFRSISRNAVEAAQLDGLSENQSIQKLGWGQQLTGIVVCFLVAFLIGFGDLSASFIPMPAGMDTLSRCILGQMHAGVNDVTAALSLVSWFFSGTISLLAILLLKHLKGFTRNERSRS